MSLLVVLEHDRGAWSEANDEAMTAGRTLASDMGADLHAVLIGDGALDLSGQAVAAGAAVVHVAIHPMLTDFGPEAVGETVVQLIAAATPDAVMAVGTSRGNEILAQVAARMDLPFVANCMTVSPADDTWSMTRIQWGGSLLEDTTLETDGPKIVSYGHHAVVAEAPPAPGAGAVQEFTPELDDTLARTIVVDRDVQQAGVTLSTAPVVVSGGRGVGSAEGFDQLEELAELLGGRVGCSRAVTNLGWRNHTDQVGQTGTRIAPEIYIATGISGAIQHWVGAMASKRILAINTDPEANMVVKADYAVIADLHKVVPAITAEIKRRKGL
ncbi:MAG: electron transfer flavoprotein subunit alpha/FixB family protein [Acidimicrobiaceae bacterium]|nr:electron transfer flavoprotein subunit alpha/FixB family protein [Acidimicrobiaceae bacterium]